MVKRHIDGNGDEELESTRHSRFGKPWNLRRKWDLTKLVAAAIAVFTLGGLVKDALSRGLQLTPWGRTLAQQDRNYNAVVAAHDTTRRKVDTLTRKIDTLGRKMDGVEFQSRYQSWVQCDLRRQTYARQGVRMRDCGPEPVRPF